MQRTSFEDVNCSVAQCLEVVGEWWTLLIIRDAFLGVRRFDDFQARLGISRNILNRRLSHLVDHGVLERLPYQVNPPRSEYRLTDKGRDLWHVIAAMRQWGDRWAAPDGAALRRTARRQVRDGGARQGRQGGRLRPHSSRIRLGVAATRLPLGKAKARARRSAPGRGAVR
jgi:DNA-binding HxlR family transcriptional regulator